MSITNLAFECRLFKDKQYFKSIPYYSYREALQDASLFCMFGLADDYCIIMPWNPYNKYYIPED